MAAYDMYESNTKIMPAKAMVFEWWKLSIKMVFQNN